MSLLRFLKIILFILIPCLILASCGNEKELQLNEVVVGILSENNIENSKIIRSISDTYVDGYNTSDIEISNDEFNKYIEDILMMHEKMVKLNDRKIVQLGDVVIISYVVRYNNEIVATSNKEALLVGSGNYLPDLENAIIGASVGKPFVCELKSPINTSKYKKDALLQYNITIESINYFEKYTSSDRYILDYYGCESEKEFIDECKIRFKNSKNQERKNLYDDEYIDKIANECKYIIDKEEVTVYSEKIVEQQKNLAYIAGLNLDEYIRDTLKMTDDEFYDYCYKKGLADVKRYLLVGAHTNEIDFVGDDFKEFCTYAGYDSNDDENLLAKYNYLKNITIADYRNLRVNAMTYKFISENDNEITAEVYDTNNVYNINYSENDGYSISDDVQQQIINSVKNINFRLSRYGDNDNHLYNKAVVLRNDGIKLAVIMIDDVNGYVKLQKDDGEIVFAKFDSTDLDEILSAVTE